MKSVTKTLINETKISELVNLNFGSEAIVDEVICLEGGMMNAAYLVKYAEPVNGIKEMILKTSYLPET